MFCFLHLFKQNLKFILQSSLSFLLIIFCKSQVLAEGGKIALFDFSFFLHQLVEYNNNGTPCFFGLDKSERQILVDKIQSCGAYGNYKLPYGPFREIYQELIFTLARDKFNEGNKCLKVHLAFLQKRDLKGFYGFWLKAASSSLANSYIYKGIATRKLNQLDLGLKNDELKAEIKEQLENIETEHSKIPLFPIEEFSDMFINKLDAKLKKMNILDSDPKDYPDMSHFRELMSEIEKIIDDPEMAERAFYDMNSYIDAQMFIPTNKSISSSMKQTLWDKGFVKKILDEVLDDQPALKAKLNSCIEGDYGAIASTVNGVTDFITSMAFGGYVTKATTLALGSSEIRAMISNPFLKALFTKNKWLLSNVARNPFSFSLNTLSYSWINTKVKDAYHICIEKNPRYALLNPPSNCENEEQMMNYSVDTLGLQSCMTEARMTVLF